MNEVSNFQIIPYDCRLTGISCYFDDLVNFDFRITLNIRSSRKKSNDVFLTYQKMKVYKISQLIFNYQKMIFCGLRYTNKVLVHK